MKVSLVPNVYVESIFEIDLKELRKKGIHNLIVDIDNTLVAWDKKTAPISVIKWFNEIKDMGLNICLVSNNTEDRVVKFTENIEIQAFHKARKPFSKTFLKAMKYMDSNRNSTVVIGDQIFTDVLGGNSLGLYTILVVPIESKEFWWTEIVRHIERAVLKNIKKNKSK